MTPEHAGASVYVAVEGSGRAQFADQYRRWRALLPDAKEEAMKHHCPMCGEQWNNDVCASCGWFEGKPARYSAKTKRASNRRRWLFQRKVARALLPPEPKEEA